MKTSITALSVGLWVGVSLAGCAGTGTHENPSAVPCAGSGNICTFMGTGRAGLGQDGVAPADVQLYLPQDLAFGPNGQPYVLDWNNHRVRTVQDGKVVTVVGTGELGDAPAGPALQTRLNHPTHVAFDPNGRLILSAWHNSKVMRMDLGTGMIEPICGTGARAFDGDLGPAEAAVLDLPVATVFDSQGRMLIMDQANQRVRRVENGIINTVVGPDRTWLPDTLTRICDPQDPMACKACLVADAANPDCEAQTIPKPQGFAGDGEAATQAMLYLPYSQSAPPAGRMEMGPNDTLFICDTGNHRVRTLDSAGITRTVAGSGPATYDPTFTGGFSGDDGPATSAMLRRPTDVAVDQDGSFYIADTDNHCVRHVDTAGIITTAAGTCGQRGFAGDGGGATSALLDRPYGVALDTAGNLYIADTHNHRIRVVYK